MPIREELLARRLRVAGPQPKRGLEIFDGGDYPTDFNEFVGQQEAKEQLYAALASSVARDKRLDHILLASGAYGIGKTSLAQIVAYQRNVGLIAVSGPITLDEAANLLSGCREGDILFWDEFHLAVVGNRSRADWLLPFLTDGVLLDQNGARRMPDITVIGATTDAGKLPQTILSRFPIRPRLEYYTDEEGTLIAVKLAVRIGTTITAEVAEKIARAASNNPRDMRTILIALRDLSYVYEGHDDLLLSKALSFAGVTPDGLTREACDILRFLYVSKNHTASMDTIQSVLGEPGPLRHHEQALMQRGYLVITGRGRALTDDGIERAKELTDEA